MKKNGYVLLEAVISLGLLSVIFFSTSIMIFNLSILNHRIINDQDKLENVRLGHYFLSEQIRCADKIKITTDKNFSLKSIVTYILDDDGGYKINHTFDFKDNKLRFGGTSDRGTSFNNELVKNILDIKIDFDDEIKLLNIKITAENILPLYLNLYLSNKEVEKKTLTN